mgnify:CR=1 FL=1
MEGTCGRAIWNMESSRYLSYKKWSRHIRKWKRIFISEDTELALRKIKNGKATDVDGILIELVKCLNEGMKKILSNYMKKMSVLKISQWQWCCHEREGERERGRFYDYQHGYEISWKFIETYHKLLKF